MRIIVLINSAAGMGAQPSNPTEAAVERAFSAVGISAEIRPTAGADLATAAERAARENPDVLVAAGGDGTISAVAGALVGTSVPLGVLPAGTLNHFAKDLGLPLDLAAAARVIVAGHVNHVDVGQVNGQTFLNNSSIGLYPHIVTSRDHQRQRLGRGKWIAMAMAAVNVFRRYPLISVMLEADGRSLPRTTPFVFIGNNSYAMNLLALGSRTRLDTGVLSIYTTNRTGRFGLLWLMFRALLGRLNQAKDFDMLTAREVRIETRKKTIRVALDGEVKDLIPPLRYRVLPKALKIIGVSEE